MNKGMFSGYKEWIALGGGLKNEGYSFDDWMRLSNPEQSSGKLRVEAEKSWKSFNEKVTGGTLTEFVRSVDPDFMTRAGAIKQLAVQETIKRETISKTVIESHKKTESKELVKADLNYPMPVENWDLNPGQVSVDQKGNVKPKGTMQNLAKMLEFYGVTVRENLMRHKIEIVFHGKEQ